MNAKQATGILRAAARTVRGGLPPTRIGGRTAHNGYVMVREGELIVAAQEDENKMIATITGIGKRGALEEGQVFILDLGDLEQWLKVVGPALKGELGKGELTITPLTAEECALRIADKEWRLKGRKEEAPETPTVDATGVNVVTKAAQLKETIRQVSKCVAGKDDTRYVLRRIHPFIKKGALYLEAANGYYMARARLPLDKALPDDPKRTLPGIDWVSFGALIEALLDKAPQGEVKMQMSEQMIALGGDGFSVVVTATGTFPDTEIIIPWRHLGAQDALLVDVGEVLKQLPEALMQTQYCPEHEYRGTDTVLLYTDDRVTVGVMGLGQDLAEGGWGIHVSGKYLKTLLEGSGRDLLQVKWSYRDKTYNPILLADDGDWIGVLMPVSVRGSSGIPQREEVAR